MKVTTINDSQEIVLWSLGVGKIFTYKNNPYISIDIDQMHNTQISVLCLTSCCLVDFDKSTRVTYSKNLIVHIKND